MDVKLYKKEGSYTDKKTGETKKSIRFYLGCGNSLIPIEVTYFENTDTGRDSQYSGRKEVLKAFAQDLPPKDGNAHE